MEDTGLGLIDLALKQIFDDSTKEKGIMGIKDINFSDVYNIIQKHKGWINVSSELGYGTKFHIYLPIAGGMRRDRRPRRRLPDRSRVPRPPRPGADRSWS